MWDVTVRKNRNTRNEDFKEQGLTHRAHQDPEVGTAQVLVTDSNPWRSPQRARSMLLHTALSENSKGSVWKECQNHRLHHSINKCLLNTYQTLFLKLWIKQWLNAKVCGQDELIFQWGKEIKHLNAHNKYYDGRKGLENVGPVVFKWGHQGSSHRICE